MLSKVLVPPAVKEALGLNTSVLTLAPPMEVSAALVGTNGITNGILLLFWFAFLWLIVRASIFLYFYWPSRIPLLQTESLCSLCISLLCSLFVINLRDFVAVLFLKDLFIFRERGKEGEREGEKHQCVVASHAPPLPTGNLAQNPGMCLDWELNRWPFALQSSAQSSEPHQPGLIRKISKHFISIPGYGLFFTLLQWPFIVQKLI